MDASRNEGIQVYGVAIPGNLEESQLLRCRLRIQNDVECRPNRKRGEKFDRAHRHHQKNAAGEERRVWPQIAQQPAKFALMFQARKSVHRLLEESFELKPKTPVLIANPFPAQWLPAEIVPCRGAATKGSKALMCLFSHN